MRGQRARLFEKLGDRHTRVTRECDSSVHGHCEKNWR